MLPMFSMGFEIKLACPTRNLRSTSRGKFTDPNIATRLSGTRTRAPITSSSAAGAAGDSRHTLARIGVRAIATPRAS